jgi:hypothetical protein
VRWDQRIEGIHARGELPCRPMDPCEVSGIQLAAYSQLHLAYMKRDAQKKAKHPYLVCVSR